MLEQAAATSIKLRQAGPGSEPGPTRNVRSAETRGWASERKGALVHKRHAGSGFEMRSGEPCAAVRAKRYRRTIMTERGGRRLAQLSVPSNERDFRCVVAVRTNRTQRPTVPGGGEHHRKETKFPQICGAVRVDRLTSMFNRELDGERVLN